jgi:putative sterol carrier protein
MKGKLEEYQAKDGTRYLVSASDTLDTVHQYKGPVAEVWFDDTWLRIQTDPYEGSVMINIEALPHMQLALKKIQKRIAAASGTQRKPNMSKRLTLSDRECHIIATIIAKMTSRAESMNAEGACLLGLARDELIELRKRVIAND